MPVKIGLYDFFSYTIPGIFYIWTHGSGIFRSGAENCHYYM